MTKPLDEADVGITCYVSSLPGFRGVLKQRYSDFIVNEVGLDGNVVHLTSLDPPPEFEEEKSEEIKPPSADRNYAEEIELFQLLAGDADTELLRGFLEKNDAPPIVLSPDPDKSHRAEVHNFFKKNFKFLVTDTIEELDGDSKRIRVRFCSVEGGGSGRRGRKRKDMGSLGRRDGGQYDSRGLDNWPEHLGKFLMFHLYKENKDTQEALGVIGKMLGTQQRSFGFAGTKDKRSISTQKVTIFKQRAKRLAALNSRLIGIKLGNFCYVKEGLVLGQLLGNRFTITLRGVVADSEDIIKAAAECLGRNGFINYYGLQRFGSGSVPTHLIGVALLRGEWKTAVGLILDPREGERAVISEARQHYKGTGDVDMALKQFPRHLVAERAILQCLKKCPGNYLQALKAIPRTLRMMYVHSYQSYLWNHAASMRVQKHGIDQAVIGDLVYSKEGPHEKLDGFNKNDVEGDINDSCEDNNLSELSDASLPEEKVHFVKAINSEDLLTGNYTFEDVVLPLPGSRIQYPENDIADSYHEMAKKDGISLRESAHGAKEFSIISMTGGYRRIFQRPTDYIWELLTYTDGNMPLAETDLDIISERKPAETKDKSINGNSGGHVEISESEITSDKNTISEDDSGSTSQVELVCSSDTLAPKMALKIGFTLPASCYATMAIRELLKTSTSVAYQKTLNP